MVGYSTDKAVALRAARMSTRYYALIGMEESPSGLMRETRDGEGLALEYLDGAGIWVWDPSLSRYFLLGDHDAVLIEEAEARIIAQELTLGRGMKELESPDREVEEEHFATVLEKALDNLRRKIERWLRETEETAGEKHLPGKHSQQTHGRGGGREQIAVKLENEIRGLSYEKFYALDSQGNIVGESKGRRGSVVLEIKPEATEVHTLLHNHPAGDRSFSRSDVFGVFDLVSSGPVETRVVSRNYTSILKYPKNLGGTRKKLSDRYKHWSAELTWFPQKYGMSALPKQTFGAAKARYKTNIDFEHQVLSKTVKDVSGYSYQRTRVGSKEFSQKQLSLSLLNLPDNPEFWATVKEDFLKDIAKADPPVSAARLMNNGAAEAASLGLAVDFGLVNEQALETARVYTNEWWQALEGSTRNGLRKAIQTNIETGAPLKGLINDIEPLFGKGRASAIAATEVTRLYAEGNRFAYASAGIQQVEWKTVRDTLVDTICDELNGDRWPLGQEQFVPPRHVNCRCRLVPVVDDEALPEPDDIVAWDPKGVGGILNYKPQLGRYHDQLRESLGKDVYIHSAETRSSLKTKVVGDIAARSGLSLRRVNEFVKTWALTSSDNSLDAIALQYVAGRKFNVSLTGFIDGTADAFARGREGSAWRLATAESERFLDAVYAQTQEMLARWGIKEFYLGRGIGGSEFTSLPEVLEYKRKQAAVRMGRRFYTEDIDFKSNPLSSWSVDAKVYGTWDSHVLFAKVPASRILSTPFTGFGCLNEFEFVVVGGLDTVRLGFGSGQWSNYFLGGVEELI